MHDSDKESLSAGRRPIRVLHLRDSPWVDGPGRTILETAAHLDPSRIEYHIGAFVTPGQQHAMVAAARNRGLKLHVINDRPRIDRKLVGDIVELIDQHHIDILHTSEFRSNVISLLCRRQRRVLSVSTAHGWIANDVRGRVFRLADKALLRYFDRVIFVSNAMRRLVPQWWVPRARIRVLHNALVLESYGKELVAGRRPDRGLNRPLRLLNVGRLSPEKGQHLLLQAFASLAVTYRSLELSFAGVGPLESSLRHAAKELGVSDRVKFLGYVADMPRIYANSDLVVQSSFTEGLPNVILEAAYLRVPIVATDVGGTNEVIEHGRTGWLVGPRSRKHLTDGIREFLEDPVRFGRMAEDAHYDVRSLFSFETRTKNLTSLYQELFGETR